MRFIDFMEMYDNWSGKLRVNDNKLRKIVEDKAVTIIDKRFDLYNKIVVAFGFYNGVMTVRVK